MLLLFSILVCFGKNCLSGLLCMSFMNVYHLVCVLFDLGLVRF